MASFGTLRNSTFDTIHASQHRKASLLGLSAYERHKLFVREYVEFYGRGTRSEAQDDGAVAAAVTERDVLIKEHRFIRGEDDDRPDTWEVRLAKRYYDRLFKEYCIVDLSRYRESKVGMRWRTEKEVVAGKGQFECGEVRCRVTEGLCSYEVNFAYREAGKGKQALVKVRLCRDCAYKLNYRKEKAYKKVTKKLRKFVDRQQAGEKTVDAPAAAGIDPETEAADPCQAGGRQRRREGPGSPLEDAEQPASKRAKRWDSKPSGAGRDDAAEGAGEQAGNAGAAAKASGVEAVAGNEGDFWRQKSSSTKQEVELEEDFDKYMQDMFL